MPVYRELGTTNRPIVDCWKNKGVERHCLDGERRLKVNILKRLAVLQEFGDKATNVGSAQSPDSPEKKASRGSNASGAREAKSRGGTGSRLRL